MFERTASVVIGTGILLMGALALSQGGSARTVETAGGVEPAQTVRLAQNASSAAQPLVIAEASGETDSAGVSSVAQSTSGQSSESETKHASKRAHDRLRAMNDDGLLLQGNRIADVAEAAAPSVVNIDIEKPGPSPMYPGLPPNFFGGGQMRFFFNGKEVNPQELGRATARLVHGTGSGFIIRNDGYILTNVHVIKDAKKITVTLHDGRAFDAKLVGVDSFSDLAVIKIEANDLPVLKMGKSSILRPGEFVVAIGSPLNYDHTVTFGIVSGVGRTVYEINENMNFIQTDAAINEGNSGGPLLNLQGEAIGVNTAVVKGYFAQNIGFSIPIDVARSVADDLIAQRKIHRPWLGLAMKQLSDAVAHGMGLPSGTRGVLVASTFENSPAERAGLKKEDIIQKIDGKNMMSPKDVRDYVHSRKVHETLNFFVLRNGSGQDVQVDIGEYPSGVDVVPHQNEKKDPASDEQDQ